MKILLISDMHIGRENVNYYEAKISALGEFIRSNIYDPLYVFVLGDIVDCGKSTHFDMANILFQKLKFVLTGWDYKIFFIPGNHDYCDKSRNSFNTFVSNNQSFPTTLEFGSLVGTFETENFNFIFCDSVNSGKYDLPGTVGH